ncbi:MAG: alpha/beta hydrolase [Halieaceae bacterium]|nr:alpha/beta hydrolase [Halieaceae bacterium]
MSLYLALAILLALCTVTALVKARRLSYGAIPWFFAGWLTGELAWFHMAWSLLLSLLVAMGDGLDSEAGRWGLILFLLSWLGLAWLHVQAMNTRAVLEAALRDALGKNYRGDIPLARQHVLDASIETRYWLRPFSMRRPGVKLHRNISYGEHGVRNTLDVYEPEEPREGGYPVLLQVHGGGWMVGAKHQQGQPLLYHLASRGWLCVACNYRLSPHSAFPHHIIDVKRSIAWIREHAGDYGGNPDFLAITGGSAGGHLAALAALTPNLAEWQPGFEEADTRLQAAVPFYGVYDFLDSEGIRGTMSMEDILARYVMQTDASEAREAWQQASPLYQVRADAPPTFLVQGTHDSLVWVEEARHFANRLRAVSDQVVAYGELPGAQHAFEVFHSVRTDQSLESVTGFLEWCHARWAAD